MVLRLELMVVIVNININIQQLQYNVLINVKINISICKNNNVLMNAVKITSHHIVIILFVITNVHSK